MAGILIVKTSTYFKLSTLDSTQLPPNQKLLIHNESGFEFLSYQAVEKNHYKVTFSEKLGPQAKNTWYVYRPDVYLEEFNESCIANYTVKSGDTLSGIAQKFYKNSTEAFWRRIYNANINVIGPNPSNLSVGQVLCIPG
jgi:nucleoid-associated protein YgaU